MAATDYSSYLQCTLQDGPLIADLLITSNNHKVAIQVNVYSQCTIPIVIVHCPLPLVTIQYTHLYHYSLFNYYQHVPMNTHH